MIINSTSLDDGQQLNFGDFNVFIGGNGVGKTTFLLELFSKAANVNRGRFYWIKEAKYSSDNVNADMKLLKSSLAKQYEGTRVFYHSQSIKNIEGNPDLSGDLRFASADFEQLETQSDVAVYNNVKYRRPFVTFSSCEARLGLQNQVGINSFDQPPADPINVLYRNKRLLEQIDKNILDIFKYHFILLDHTRANLYLGLSEELPPGFDSNTENQQSEYEKIQNWKESKFKPLSESGHGIRSMIRLLTSLLEPVNQVIMIDEPEMHLYPSQKRWLGKQLVELAKIQKKQVFVVTHDPMVLQGVLDANTKTNIFRVDRDDTGIHKIQSCELEQITDINAMRNQEQYLQGLFYQRCIVVEGASDRSFYQNMFEDFTQIRDKDLGFVGCSGKASTKHVANIATRVGLKAAFIYDFDVLINDAAVIKDVYNLLGGTGNPLTNIEKIFDAEVNKKNAGKERGKIIKELTGYNDKKGMTSTWARDNRVVFDEAVTLLGNVGIFIVPNGSLESWAPEVEPKVRFAEKAPLVLREDVELKNAFTTFAKKVLAYLDIKIS